MVKICDSGIVKPLYLIYEKSIMTGTFPDVWKKANFLPVHKKEKRQKKTTGLYRFCLFMGKYFKR